MDVIKLCGNSAFIKRERIIECTPDEAATFAGMLAKATAAWLDDADAYANFIAENGK